MARLNNKGISLVEIIIAIAVMALLSTPIIMQVSSTLDNSANAKERQHAIEGADEVMEYFRSKDLSELKAGGNIDDTLSIVGSPTVTSDITCNLYDKDGHNLGSVKYSATDFVLNSVDLSKLKDSISGVSASSDLNPQRKIYDRFVTISDLNNKLSEKKYEIDYQSYVFGSTLPNELTSVGMEVLSDNTVCVTDSNNHITSVVVKEKGLDFQDPNTVSLGNIQDLDSSKMAVITGDATSLDYKLENDLRSLLITYAKKPENKTTSLGQVSNNTTALNNQINLLIGSATSVPRKRLIHISITADPSATEESVPTVDGSPVVTPGVAPKYFHVRCDVIYDVKFVSANPPKIFNDFTSSEGRLSYKVLDRDYYVSSPPDIYMVYEPMLLSTSSSGNSETGTTDYAQKEYIYITTDKFTGGYLYKDYLADPNTHSSYSKYDPSKLYLIRSDENWENVVGTTKSNTDPADANLFCYTFNSNVKPVDIYVNQYRTTTESSKQLPIQVVTNVGASSDLSIINEADPLTADKPWKQFDIQASAEKFGLSDNPTAYPHKLDTVKDEAGNDADSIVSPLQDSRFEGKLYRMTVTYKKVESIEEDGTKNYGESIYLTGAKGAD
jgi:type II secretory pathway pseudopilin PulG